MPSGRSDFRVDLDKYYRIEYGTDRPSLGARLKLWLFHFGFHCTAVYRFGRAARRLTRSFFPLGLPLLALYRLMDMGCRVVHHVHVGEADIGPGFYIGHVGTIYLAPVTIGRNFSLTHNVTIGIGHVNGIKGSPSAIGDNVWIGTGSVVSGPISIGHNVTIASGCILSRSVPDGCLAAGNPGRVTLRDYDNRHLFAGVVAENATSTVGCHDSAAAPTETEPDEVSDRAAE